MKKLILFLLIAVLILSGCTNTPALALAESCHNSIVGMLKIQEKVQASRSDYQSLSDYLLQREIYRGGPRKAGWFDVSEFFSVLPHIRAQRDYTIDYVQFPDMHGGPILYARKINEYPYSSFKEWQQEHLQRVDQIREMSDTPEEKDKAYSDYHYQYMNFIRTDGSAEGFVEFLIFRMMGNQFYLSGTSNYHDARALCNTSDLEKALKDANTRTYPDEENLNRVLLQAQRIDLSPKVEFRKGMVIVKLFFFTKFGGLYESETKIRRVFPHVIVDEHFERIVEYDAPFVY